MNKIDIDNFTPENKDKLLNFLIENTGVDEFLPSIDVENLAMPFGFSLELINLFLREFATLNLIREYKGFTARKYTNFIINPSAITFMKNGGFTMAQFIDEAKISLLLEQLKEVEKTKDFQKLSLAISSIQTILTAIQTLKI